MGKNYKRDLRGFLLTHSNLFLLSWVVKDGLKQLFQMIENWRYISVHHQLKE